MSITTLRIIDFCHFRKIENADFKHLASHMVIVCWPSFKRTGISQADLLPSVDPNTKRHI